MFTDLDGTLLDHQSYSYAAALPTLNRLQRNNVPVILASSKTSAEMLNLRRELGLDAFPMICENGSGQVPAGSVSVDDGAIYDKLRGALNDLPQELRGKFHGFADMGPAGVATATGLSLDDATLASRRQFSEPGQWHGSKEDLAVFLAELAKKGVFGRSGGRFLTLSFGARKSDQMAEIITAYGAKIVVALGDAPNDAEMLSAAHYAIVLPNAHGHPVNVKTSSGRPEVIRPINPGPVGWADAMSVLLTRLGVGA